MEDYRLQTPEQVDIRYTVSGLGTRFIALALDGLIQAALFAGLLYVFYQLFRHSARFLEWYTAIVIFLYSVIHFGYFLLLELLMRGRTPGKAAAGVRVVRMDGRPVDGAGTLLRNLVRLIDWLPLFYGVGVIAMFVNRDSRRLGDLAGGTVVIVDRKRTTLHSVIAAQGRDAAPEALTDSEYAVIRDFFARCPNLSPEARAQLASNIAAPLYRRMGVPPVHQDEPEEFLYGLLHPSAQTQPTPWQQRTPAPHPGAGAPGVPAALTPQDHESVLNFFAQSAALSPSARAELAARTAAPLYDRLRVPPAQRGDPEGFLRHLAQTGGMFR